MHLASPTIHHLPYELLCNIFSYLDPKDEKNIQKVCTRWRNLSLGILSKLRRLPTPNLYALNTSRGMALDFSSVHVIPTSSGLHCLALEYKPTIFTIPAQETLLEYRLCTKEILKPVKRRSPSENWIWSSLRTYTLRLFTEGQAWIALWTPVRQPSHVPEGSRAHLLLDHQHRAMRTIFADPDLVSCWFTKNGIEILAGYKPDYTTSTWTICGKTEKKHAAISLSHQPSEIACYTKSDGKKLVLMLEEKLFQTPTFHLFEYTVQKQTTPQLKHIWEYPVTLAGPTQQAFGHRQYQIWRIGSMLGTFTRFNKEQLFWDAISTKNYSIPITPAVIPQSPDHSPIEFPNASQEQATHMLTFHQRKLDNVISCHYVDESGVSHHATAYPKLAIRYASWWKKDDRSPPLVVAVSFRSGYSKQVGYIHLWAPFAKFPQKTLPVRATFTFTPLRIQFVCNNLAILGPEDQLRMWNLDTCTWSSNNANKRSRSREDRAESPAKRHKKTP